MRTGQVHEKTQRLIWLPTGGHIGDAIMVVALFAEVTRKMPHLEILYVVRRNASVIAELAHEYPAVTIVPLPYAPWPAFLTVVGLLQKRAIVIAPPARKIHPRIIKILSVLFMLRGDRVIGFQDPRDPTRWHPYHVRINYDPKARYIDNLRKALLLAPLPTNAVGSPPQLKLASYLPSSFPFKDTSYIVLHAFGHMSTTKSMPLRRWKDLVRNVRREYPSYAIVVTGAEADRVEAQEMASGDKDIFLAIDLPLLELAGIISGARLYIGIDTGPTHLAGVLSAPSIVLAQQNDPAWLPDYNPKAVLLWSQKDCVCGVDGENCVVWEEGKDYRRCVYGITDEQLLAAIRGIL